MPAQSSTPRFHPSTTPAERAELERYAATRGDDGPGVIEEWNAILDAAERRPIDDETRQRVELSARELEAEGLDTAAAGVRRRLASSRGEAPATGQRPGWLSTTLRAWDDTRAALMAFDRGVLSVQPDARQQPREVRRALDAIRRADRTRPSFVQLSGVGDEPRDPSWTETQLRRMQAAARALRAQLERAQEDLRELRRLRPAGGAFDQAADAAETAITGILRPLSLAVATATGPAQRGLATGAGLGLGFVAAVALLFFMPRRT